MRKALLVLCTNVLSTTPIITAFGIVFQNKTWNNIYAFCCSHSRQAPTLHFLTYCLVSSTCKFVIVSFVTAAPFALQCDDSINMHYSLFAALCTRHRTVR